MTNLNELRISNDDGRDEPLMDPSISSEGGRVEVFFRGIEENLIKAIDQADIVVGCVAWLTSWPILKALSKKDGVSIVVQKEDFLRPDSGPVQNKTRKMYENLPASLTRMDTALDETVLADMSCSSDPTIDAVRCVGNHNSSKTPSSPRAHHKFIVLCKVTSSKRQYEPYAVWTGSYNFSHNATRSLENAVLIHDRKIARAYFAEWAQIAAMSEPLNWEVPWCDPEWRIGT